MASCLLGARSAAADAAQPVEGPPGLTAVADRDLDTQRRLRFLVSRLEAGAPAAERWCSVWFYSWTALSTLQATLALSVSSPELRKDAAVGAAFSSLAPLQFALFPFPARYGAAPLRHLPEATPAQREEKLQRAERLLRASAEAERRGRSWVPHVLSSTVSVGMGLLLAFAYHRPVTALVNGAAGIVLMQTQIWTQPTAAITAWKSYEAGDHRYEPPTPLRIAAPRPRFSVAPLGLGAAVVGEF